MAATSITDYFRRLNAPLLNSRWSWGSVREEDQALFLRVWGDQSITQGASRYYRLTAYSAFESKPKDRGWLERQRHLAMLQDTNRKAPTYMVICTAKDTASEPRAIADFDPNTLFEGGELIQHAGDWWLEARTRVEAYDARQIQSDDPPDSPKVSEQESDSLRQAVQSAKTAKAIADIFHAPASEPRNDAPR
jgi:hypothetical protein